MTTTWKHEEFFSIPRESLHSGCHVTATDGRDYEKIHDQETTSIRIFLNYPLFSKSYKILAGYKNMKDLKYYI